MLRLPRRTPRNLGTRRGQSCKPALPIKPTYLASLILSTNVKIHWSQFEALRIKLARALTAKRKLSRKNLHRQKQAQKKKRQITPRSQPKQPIACYYGFPHLAYRVKGRGSRMGKGKGNIACWYYKGRAGNVLLVFKHINPRRLQAALHKITRLLPTKPVFRRPRTSSWCQNEILN